MEIIVWSPLGQAQHAPLTYWVISQPELHGSNICSIPFSRQAACPSWVRQMIVSPVAAAISPQWPWLACLPAAERPAYRPIQEAA
jgi:hypothetical protein